MTSFSIVIYICAWGVSWEKSLCFLRGKQPTFSSGVRLGRGVAILGVSPDLGVFVLVLVSDSHDLEQCPVCAADLGAGVHQKSLGRPPMPVE